MVRHPRWFLAKIVAVAVVALYCAICFADGFMVDVQHTGRSPHTGPSRPFRQGRLELGERVLGGPVWADGNLLVGTMEGTLVCVSGDLTLVWSVSLGGKVLATPLVDESGDIYVGTAGGIFYCLSSQGNIKWSRSYGQGIVSSAITDDQNVYFGVWDGRLMCLSKTGEKQWEFWTDYVVYSSPALDHRGNIVVASADGSVYSLSANGIPNWRFKTGDSIYASPSVDRNGNVFVGSYDTYFYSLSSGGELRWKIKTPYSIHGTAAVDAAGNVYFASLDEYLYAVSNDGELLWKRRGGFLGSPIIDATDSIYVSLGYGSISRVSPSGDIQVDFPADSGDHLWGAQPVLTENGRLYYVSVAGVVHCMGDDPVAAQLVTSVELGRSLHGLQETDAELVALDWNDGSLYLIDTATWEYNKVRELTHILMDIVIEGGILYAGMNGAGTAVLSYELVTGRSASPIELDGGPPFIDNELWGIEKDAGHLYLLGRGEAGQRLVIYDLSARAFAFAGSVPPGIPELIGLELRGGRLFTFAWAQGIIYDVRLLEHCVALDEFREVEFLVPYDEIAPGGFRGFHFGREVLYLTSVAYGVFSRIHAVPYPEAFWDELE